MILLCRVKLCILPDKFSQRVCVMRRLDTNNFYFLFLILFFFSFIFLGKTMKKACDKEVT